MAIIDKATGLEKRYVVTLTMLDGSRYSFNPVTGSWTTYEVEWMTGPEADKVYNNHVGDSKVQIVDMVVATEIMKVRRSAEDKVLKEHGYDDLPYEVRKNAHGIRLAARLAGDRAVRAAGFVV